MIYAKGYKNLSGLGSGRMPKLQFTRGGNNDIQWIIQRKQDVSCSLFRLAVSEVDRRPIIGCGAYASSSVTVLGHYTNFLGGMR